MLSFLLCLIYNNAVIMILSIIVSITVCLFIVVTSIVKPNFSVGRIKINFYWIIALLGALVLLISKNVDVKEWWNLLTKSEAINPIQILILFLSMSAISIFLDEVGFFARLASWVLKRANKSQVFLFVILYIFVSILTMFTSNDIIILTLTPFILLFCKNAKISPIPYLVSEFIAANTWSMIFIIGNPTNIYLASSFGISFIDYFKVMAIPTLLTGITEFSLLFLIFRKKLNSKINPVEVSLNPLDKVLVSLGLSILAICTIFLVISGYFSIPMYIISAISFATLVFLTLVYFVIKRKTNKALWKTFLRLPYELIPFIVGMFTIVLSLQKYGISEAFASFFGENLSTFSYGFSSALVANLINNIPMSVFYSSICSFTNESIKLKAIYSSIIGSNLGAFISPFGALAGIMWLSILKNYDVKYGYVDFIKYGVLVGIPSLLVSLSSLLLFL